MLTRVDFERRRTAIRRLRLPERLKLNLLREVDQEYISNTGRCPGCDSDLTVFATYDRGLDGFECEACR
jgi:hypothetical protein